MGPDGRWCQARTSQGPGLQGVTALSSTDVWAVGDVTPPGESFAIHWDGSAWTQVPIPSKGAETYPQDVDGIASNDVWAVGYDTPNYEDWHTLMLHWDGAKWRVYPHPIPYGPQQYFYGVTAIPGGEAWAVGSSLWSGPEITCTQRFGAC